MSEPYRILYKGEEVPIATWRTAIKGKGTYGFIHYKYKDFKKILWRLKKTIHYEFDHAHHFSIVQGSRVVIEVKKYDDPRHWEQFRVRFYTTPQETKVLVKLIKEKGFNFRTIAG